ncbi:hypothetical protein FKP32DRAFT_1177269 [Trametes sanguinea]|nr:hypothetical protein FKP32DRAFT_1177269 [Trametes sanguinea]
MLRRTQTRSRGLGAREAWTSTIITKMLYLGPVVLRNFVPDGAGHLPRWAAYLCAAFCFRASQAPPSSLDLPSVRLPRPGSLPARNGSRHSVSSPSQRGKRSVSTTNARVSARNAIPRRLQQREASLSEYDIFPWRSAASRLADRRHT